MIVGGKHHRMLLFGQLVIQHRERLSAPLRFAAKPGSQNPGRTLLQQIRLGVEDHRQLQRTAVTRI